MNMAVEIFVEPELENLSEIDNATEWKGICQALGLHGQSALAERSAENRPPGYPSIDPKTENIIRVLCPRKVKIEEYNKQAIPLEVLKAVQECKEHGWYPGGIYVFYDDQSKDPFIVGFTGTKWNDAAHLIARFGAELLPFEELEIKAIKRYAEQVRQEMRKMKAAVDLALDNTEDFARAVFTGATIPSLTLNINRLSW